MAEMRIFSWAGFMRENCNIERLTKWVDWGQWERRVLSRQCR
jgi:hypothetical protein